MALLESDFVRRVRFMTEDKRALLLDTMKQTHQELKKIFPTYHHATYTEKVQLGKELLILFQKPIIAAWLLLDQPQKRTAQQVKERLEEIERLAKYHKFHDMYAATNARIKTGQNHKEEWIFTFERIPKDKKDEYENCFTDYTKLSDADREKFIAEVTHPYSQHKTYPPIQMGRQRED